jgi:hypothetical protein
MAACAQPAGSDAPNSCATSGKRERACACHSMRLKPWLDASSNCPLSSSSSQTLSEVSHLYAMYLLEYARIDPLAEPELRLGELKLSFAS